MLTLLIVLVTDHAHTHTHRIGSELGKPLWIAVANYTFRIYNTNHVNILEWKLDSSIHWFMVINIMTFEKKNKCRSSIDMKGLLHVKFQRVRQSEKWFTVEKLIAIHRWRKKKHFNVPVDTSTDRIKWNEPSNIWF